MIRTFQLAITGCTSLPNSKIIGPTSPLLPRVKHDTIHHHRPTTVADVIHAHPRLLLIQVSYKANDTLGISLKKNNDLEKEKEKVILFTFQSNLL